MSDKITDFTQVRSNMVEQQIRPWDVLDQRVLDLLSRMPREDFVPAHYRNLAFADTEIPLGHGQVMMSPKVEGRLLQALDLKPSDRILEVGTGSGYLSACLAQLGAHVVSVDIIAEFTRAAQDKLKIHHIDNVTLRTGNAAQGWGNQRFDAIAITGSLTRLHERWQQQLTLGGRLFVIVGKPPVMEALLITRREDQRWIQTSLFDTHLPPLLDDGAAAPAFEF